MSSILLYVGTVLIAFQVVGDLAHLFALPLHSIRRVGAAIGSRRKEVVTRGRSAFLNAFKNVPRQILLLLLLVVLVAIAIVIVGVWIVGQFLRYINSRLNSAYLEALDPRKTKYIRKSRAFLAKMGKDDPHVSDLKRWEQIRQRGFPFTAFIGIIILTAGFALQLLGR